MIPKRLFWCWFGPKPLSDINIRCLESWRRFLPDYEIIKISEENFDYQAIPLAYQAYQNKAYALVADIARFEFLKQGGFYLDVDTELYQSLDSLRDNKAVIASVQNGLWGNGVLGCPPGELPEIYQMAYSAFLKTGTLVTETFLKVANEKYNLLGDDYAQVEGVGFYGERYFANERFERNPDTIGFQHNENSWVGGWTPNGFGRFVDPFVVDIYRDNVLNKKLCQAWFKNKAAQGRLDVSGDKDVDIWMLGLGNYFFNSRVVGLEGQDFKFTRYTSSRFPLRKKSLFDGNVLVYEVR